MAFIAAAAPALGGAAAGALATTLLQSRANRHESTLQYAPRNQYAPESIADQRNSPNFHPRVNVFIGGNEMVELCNTLPTDHALPTAATTQPPHTALFRQLRSQHTTNSLAASSLLKPTPLKIGAVAATGATLWAIHSARAAVARGRQIQKEGWCATQKSARELLQHTPPAQAMRSLDGEIEQLQSAVSVMRMLCKLHLGFICGVGPVDIEQAEAALAQSRVLKHHIAELL